MTDLDLHHEFDGLDTGISDHPDLAGLWAGGQRRRRRTRAIWTAAGLATAAVVAPLALVVGGGAESAPTTPGIASQPAAAPTDLDPVAEMTAAVTERFPDAQQDAADPTTFTLSSGVTLDVYSGAIPAGDSWQTCEDRGDCESSLDGRIVSILKGHDDPDPRLFTAVHVTPAGLTDPAVDVWVRATSTEVTEAEAEAQLPSVATLTDLALDERLSVLLAGGGAPEPAVSKDEGPQFDAMRAAVLEAFPPADDGFVASSGVDAYNDPIDGEGLYLLTEAGLRITAYAYASGERLPCPEGGCEQVGDRNVVVADDGPVEIEGNHGKWIRTVQVFPTDPARTDMVEVSAAVSAASREDADAKLPSVETLTDLALDERLAPPAL